MDKIQEAQAILETLGLPPAQRNEMAALTLLALCGLRPTDSWEAARREKQTVSKGIMAFVARHYGKIYAPNTRETFRRQVLHQFVQAHIAEYNPFAPNLPTNSPHTHYAITEAALTVIQAYGTAQWQTEVANFQQQQERLLTLYQAKRTTQMIPVRLPAGIMLELSPGKHNELQAAVIEQFAPRFAPGASVLYLGDTAQKALHIDTKGLLALGVSITEHNKLPDVVLHDEQHNRLLLVEAVTSHGPMTPKRTIALREMFAASTASCIFISAFPDFTTFRKYLKSIAWETEVWLAEIPEHMIHFNGDRFLSLPPNQP